MRAVGTDSDFLHLFETYGPLETARRHIIADGAFTLTHGANLVCPGTANITCAANDSFDVYADTTTKMYILNYTRANGTPLVIGAGSIVQASLASGVIAVGSSALGAKLMASANTVRTILNSATPSITKSIYVPRAGTLTIYFEISGDGTFTGYAQIYRNGSPVGTVRSRVTASYLGYSEDIAGWSAGDSCQIAQYTQTPNGTSNVQNFRISEASPLSYYVITD